MENVEKWLRKALEYKERIVLGALILALVFSIYQVFNPGGADNDDEPPKPPEQIPAPKIPEEARRASVDRGQFNTIYSPRNIFQEITTSGGDGASVVSDEESELEKKLRLINVQESSGKKYATIRWERSRGRTYKEGATFQSDYTIIEIDVDKEEVALRSSRSGKVFRFSK